MKSFFFVIAALLMMASPAMALSVDHDSNYADASGGSRFSDPDDQLSGSSQFGMVQLGSGSSSDSSGPSFTFGFSASNNDQIDPSTPGYAMQGCLATVCQR